MINKISDTGRFMAYFCPACSEICKDEVNAFMFSGTDSVKFVCKSDICGEDCVSISRSKDKIVVSVECSVCGQTHTYRISLQSFLTKDIITFACPECNIKIFFIGKQTFVERALEENYDSISEFQEELDDFKEEIGTIYDIVDLVYAMIQDKDIVCSCGSTDITPDVVPEGLVLSCKACGKRVVLPVTEETLEHLENADKFEF